MQTPEGLIENGNIMQGRFVGENFMKIAKMQFEGEMRLNAKNVDLSTAKCKSALYKNIDDNLVLQCTGTLNRSWMDEGLDKYISEVQYIGARMPIQGIEKYRTLIFEGKRERANGQPTIVLVDKKSKKAHMLFYKSYRELDTHWHTYEVSLPAIGGNVELIFNGGYTDRSGSKDSCYLFKNIRLNK
jgi:hypothetical protein